MSEPKYREWILETIDSLRSRKARPDLERICRMVRRRYGSDPDRTRTELEKLIQEQTVLKVSYKGSISYRNAAKVQRKSRKKIDQPTGSGEAVVKQTKHTNFNNNGDRAHGPTETKETRTKDPVLTKANQCCDPQSKTLVITAQNDEAVLVSASGNSCLSCGAAVCTSQARCAAGSGGVQASVPKDKKLPQTGGSSNSTGGDKGTSNNNGSGASGKTRGTRGVEAGLSGHEGSNDKEKKTCTIVNASNSHLLRQKQQTSFKPKLRVGAKGTSRGIADPNNLGDRLVASVRALAEKSRGTAAARGHTALGLKEILGFLSSQERLSQEKLTRSKVKVVLEREVERGRLRRTRFGNITLPVRGVGAPKPSARLLKSALQDRHISKKVKEMEPMETDSGEEEEREGDMGAKECPNGGDSAPCLLAGKQEGLSAVEPHSTPSVDPVARPTKQAKLLLGSSFGNDITDPISGSTAKGRSPPPSSSCPAPQQEACSDKRCRSEVPPELHAGAGTVGGTRPQPLCPSAQRETEGGPEETSMEESVVTPEQLVPDSQDPVMLVTESKDIISTIHTQSCSGCKMESGVSSCLLTPTASPQELGVVEEQGLNGGVFVKMEKSGQNLVEWSVADVASYFIAAGFPEQAAAFRTQEIDGKSLLLMQRNDVLTGLSIRLGPALKIYERHVKVLQRTHFQEDGTLC